MCRYIPTILILASFLSGCVGTNAVFKRNRTPASIIRSLRLVHPKELTIDVARERMVAEGFACELVENGNFSTRTWQKKQAISNADFLHCKRELEKGFDDVALVVENGNVTDVLINWNER